MTDVGALRGRGPDATPQRAGLAAPPTAHLYVQLKTSMRSLPDASRAATTYRLSRVVAVSGERVYDVIASLPPLLVNGKCMLRVCLSRERPISPYRVQNYYCSSETRAVHSHYVERRVSPMSPETGVASGRSSTNIYTRNSWD